ncbi:MAG TPA: formimidoylglutamase [Chryseobacterium sp.]|nr:formimidoylglutamase [Chryseobacterium sp.]
MMFNWTGRFDGEEDSYQRIFQRVKTAADYNAVDPNDFVLHGFAVDEGVKRNKGRVGAQKAPDVIRKNMSNFPVFNYRFSLKDFGNIHCDNQDLETTQIVLAEKVAQVLAGQGKSVVLGGGHEVTFAHYSGIRKAFPNQKIGIINFDAHFDNRQPENDLATSGTGFWQIAQQGEMHSLHIGIQKNSNTQKLFEIADNFGMKYILADEIYAENIPNIMFTINSFLEDADVVYVTICMDVFNAAIAPGVSAPAYNGIFADHSFMQIFRHILSQPKTKALDVAEVNPDFDIQERTARLAASLVNEWFMI